MEYLKSQRRRDSRNQRTHVYRSKKQVDFLYQQQEQKLLQIELLKTKIKICNLKKGQELTIVGLSGSKEEARTFTAEENLEVISGMKPTLAEHTSKAIVKADGDIVIGCTNAMNVYSISISAADDTGITQATVNKPCGNDKFYTIDGKLVKPTHKGIIIAKGKKYANK